MNKVKPTRLQKKTLEILAENPNMPLGKAMITAGYAEKSAEAPGQNFLDRRGTEVAMDQFRDKLRGKGLNEDRIIAKLEEMLEAKTIKTSLTEPDRVVPDYKTQIEALKMVREDLGIRATVAPTVTFNFNQKASQQREEYDI